MKKNSIIKKLLHCSSSSTIKIYSFKKEIKLIKKYFIYFKNDFELEKDISESNLKELCDFFEKIKVSII